MAEEGYCQSEETSGDGIEQGREESENEDKYFLESETEE